MQPNLNPPSRRDKTTARDLFAQPTTWDELVAGADSLTGTGPIELEIGSGKGLFLLAASAQRPTHAFFGIELAAKFANGAADRLAKHQRTNATVLRGDAQKFLAQVIPADSLAAIHVYFPDPWWRNKHKKRRVLNESAIMDIQRSLLPEGQLHFWTDVLDYYEHICSQVMELTTLAGPKFVPQRAAAHSMDYTTHFERRARTHGQPVYRALFVKPALSHHS